MDVALEALYVLGVLMCCALLSREEGSREGLGSRRARLFMLALAVEAMQAGLGSLAFREPWGAVCVQLVVAGLVTMIFRV